MAEPEEITPLKAATQGIRDAAKYLVAGFGAIGAVLVGGLSFTALPSGTHPVLAALAIAAAVLALAILIGLAVSVLTPEAVTLGQLANLEKKGLKSSVVERLKDDETLFVGQEANLETFHRAYAEALKARAVRQEAYLAHPDDAHKRATEVASARAEFLDEAAAHVLETANFFRVQERFSPYRRALMTVLALLVVAAAAVFAWASAAPASPPEPQKSGASQYSSERIWLEHLVATSDYRIEKLDQEAENSSIPAVRMRVGSAEALQRRVQRRERNAIRDLAAESAS
jgi:hypothetical protein